jgi:hypothetical protein
MRLVKKRAAAVSVPVMLCGLCVAAMTVVALAQTAPQYRFDPTWPKLPLPNQWAFGGVTGLTVDSNDVVWIAHRPNNLDETENYATFDPPRGECCVSAPAIMAFNASGDLVHAWGESGGHMLLVDQKGQVWVGSDTFRIYTQEGELIAEVPRVVEATRTVRAGGGVNEGPGGGGGRGGGRAGGRGGQRTPYPAGVELIAGGVEGAAFDEDAREVYLVDNYLGGRVLVIDMDTYDFKRGWGAYGKPLSEISLEMRPPLTDPDAEPYPDFVSHVTLALADDGIVYVADRRSNRIQTFTGQGEYLNEYFVAPETLDRGSTGGLALSPDQNFLFVGDIMNNVVWTLNRSSMEVVDRFGFFGRNGGGFHWLHMIATDSMGNIYTGEVDTGRRIQRFLVQ